MDKIESPCIMNKHPSNYCENAQLTQTFFTILRISIGFINKRTITRK